MNYIVYGSQSILIKKRVDKLTSSIVSVPNDFNVVTFDFEMCNFDDVINETTMLGFGCDKKVVVIKNSNLLFDLKVNLENIEKLKKCVEKLSNNISLIFYFNVPVEQMKKELIKKGDKNLEFVRKYFEIIPISEVTSAQWIDIVSKACLKRNYEIDPEAITLLVSRCGFDLSRIINEIEKLGEYNSHITSGTIEKLVNIPLEESVFEVAQSLVSKKVDKTLNALHDLYLQKYEATSLIPVILSQLRFMYEVIHLTNSRMSDKQIATVLEQNGTYRIAKTKEHLVNTNEKEIMDIIKKIADLDYQIKTGQVDRFDSLELLCINVLKDR